MVIYELHVFKNYRPWWKLGFEHHKCMIWTKTFNPADFIEELNSLRLAMSDTGWSVEVMKREAE